MALAVRHGETGVSVAPNVVGLPILSTKQLPFGQLRSKRQLTREDGREIIANMSGFFSVLQEWHRAECAGKKGRRRAAP